MLQPDGFFDALTIHLHRVLCSVLLVWHEHRGFFITVEVQAALFVGDTDALNLNRRCEFGVFLSNVIVTLVQSIFDHATHARILVDIPELRGGPKPHLLLLLLGLLLLLELEFAFELFFLAFHLGESLFLLFHLALELGVARAAATASTPLACGSAISQPLDLLSQLSDEFILS